MNQEKIGKLIAKLRKEKGLTQRELGEKVGVGYRAVSKWETGLTMPDISIINDLSSILGISSDELLKGELNKKNNQSNNKPSIKKLLLLLIPIIIIAIIVGIVIANRNKTYVYKLETYSDEYYATGKIIFKGDKDASINIDSLEFKNLEFSKTIINNYQYQLFSGDKFIFGYGYSDLYVLGDEPISINEFAKNFNIDYNHIPNLNKNDIVNNTLVLIINFKNEKNMVITKKLELSLAQQY